MTQTIDKLIYALDADTSALKARFAESEAAAAATGQKMGASFSAPLKAAASSAVADAQKLKTALGDVEQATTKGGQAAHGALRYYRELFDELSSGRTKYIPSTLATLLTQFYGLSGATLAWGAAIAAIPVAFAVAASQADASLSKIRQSLALTDGASGLTLSGAVGNASMIALQAGASPLRAQGIEASLNSAYVPRGSQVQAGVAEIQAGRAGMGSEEVSKLITAMFSEPSKAAEELNKQMHLLTGEQTETVRRLQQHGQYEQAGDIILQNFTDRTREAAAQAGVFSKMLSNAGQNLGNFWHWLGTLGAPQTDQEKLEGLQRQYADAIASGSGPTRGSVGLAAIASQIQTLEIKIIRDNNAADARQKGDQARQLGDSLDPLLNEFNRVSDRGQQLKDTLVLVDTELSLTTGQHDKWRDSLVKYESALKASTAPGVQESQTPAALAAQAAADAKRTAATPEAQRAVVAAQIAAQREYMRNLANPDTSLSASAVRQSQMSSAGLVKTTKQSDEEGKKFASVLASITEHLQIIANGNTGLAGEVAANGNPQAIAAAKRNAEYADELAKARKEETGLTKQQIALLEKQLAQLPQELALRDSLKAQIAGNSAAYSTQQGLRNAQQRYGAAAGGASSDDIRDLEIAQQTLDELVKDGLDPTTDAFKKLFDTLVQGRTQTAELTQRMQENAKSGSAFASDITNPLTTALEGKYKKGSDFYRAVGGNVADTGIKTFITDPLQKGLSSVFGGLFGIGGKPDGSMNNPFYVAQSPIGAALGITGGGGLNGILGGLGSLVGLGGKSSGGGIFGTIAQGIGSLFGGGLASGGWVDPGKFYVVGENGPEILGPGTNGLISPMSSAPDVGQSSTPTTLNTHVSSTITVKGMGDQDILAKAQRGAQETVRMGIEANNKALGRTQRGSLINSNKRALV